MTPTPFDEFRLLWSSYALSPSADTQRDLLRLMDEIKQESELTEQQWDELTLSLPGFDSWWDRVRAEFLEEVRQHFDAD